jgi:hypothetical protein
MEICTEKILLLGFRDNKKGIHGSDQDQCDQDWKPCLIPDEDQEALDEQGD